jgi:hypothetical protein
MKTSLGHLPENLLAAALASDDPDAALEALERDPRAPPEVVAGACIAHAHHLLAIVPSPLETRERALRKAARATRIVEEMGAPEALQLAALRAHVDAQRAIPGRLAPALERGLTLIAMLERAPDDTRAERAARWLDRGYMTVPWANGDERARFSRAEGATSEAALRRALALYEDLGDLRGVGDCAAALVQLLLRCGAFTALDGAAPRDGASSRTCRGRCAGWQTRCAEPRPISAQGQVTAWNSEYMGEVVPLPTSPEELLPRHANVPSLLRTHVCE